MSRFQQIRDWMQANPGPRTAAEIAEGIGHDGPRLLISFAIGTMVTDGWLVNTTPHNKPARFALLRTEKIIRAKPDPETKRKQRRDRERERDQARRTLTPAQYQAWLAGCKERTAEQRAADEAEALRIQKMASDLRAANSARAAVRRMKAAKPAAQQPSVAKRVPPTVLPRAYDVTAALPAAPRVESVAEWQARTGQAPQVLQDGEGIPESRRFRHIGRHA